MSRACCISRLWLSLFMIFAIAICPTSSRFAHGDTPKQSLQAVTPDHAAQMTRGLDLFKNGVREILLHHCAKCHGAQKVEGELDLMDREGLLRGGASGPAIVAGNARDSLLYKLITHGREPHMPHNRPKLADQAIAQLAAWIDCGAPYDLPLRPVENDSKAWTRKTIAPAAKQFWSFQPLGHVTPPPVKNEKWVSTVIDRFILAKLETAGITPNERASKQQLVRRAYFDLLGLPPDPAVVEAFESEISSDAYERLIDRLLDSPHYGERWARHWLDLARFAESHGFEHDYDRPSAYHYRDFVIKALNDDLPYDTFVKWQLAGDEYARESFEALAATGFLAAGVHSTQITKREVEKQRYDEMDDMLATTGTALLGLTLGCARCHDHKYDPVPQRDYYHLLATFTTTVRSEIDFNLHPQAYQRAKNAFELKRESLLDARRKYEHEELPLRLGQWESAKGRKSAVLAWQGIEIDLFKSAEGAFSWNFHDSSAWRVLALPASKRAPAERARLLHWYRIMDPHWRQLNQAIGNHARQAPKPDTVKLLVSTEGLPAIRLHTQGDDYFKTTYFLRRGDPDQKEGIAGQGFLQVLNNAERPSARWCLTPPKGWRTSYRRRSLAEWLADVDQGAGQLLARVIVNRLWQHHLGRGLVATPSDFGARGDRPSHPELLDWLAKELIRCGWHLKPIHKLIMTSSVYQESSAFDPEKSRLDPENRLSWRHTPRRLEAEALRDSFLATSGELDSTMFGPGTLDTSSKRRSIYLTVKRSKLAPMMQVFDAPEALGGVGERPTSTVAPQALLLMNNPEIRRYSRSLAQRCLMACRCPMAPQSSVARPESSKGVPPSDNRVPWPRAVRAAYAIALGRSPTTQENAVSVSFLSQQMESYRADHADAQTLALTDFCQALMCTNEFVYVE